MKCPHCLHAYHSPENRTHIVNDKLGSWFIVERRCSNCELANFTLCNSEGWSHPRPAGKIKSSTLVHPYGSSRPPCPIQVPKPIAEDYTEACLVLPLSPKASAALSRRCLQHLLRDAAGVNAHNLAEEIQQVIDGGKLPTHVAQSIDAIRQTGNFSAHPMKAANTGDIVPVEPEEAEWNLDVLEMLFDFYYVQPKLILEKRAALNQKLQAAGKPPMK